MLQMHSYPSVAYRYHNRLSHWLNIFTATFHRISSLNFIPLLRKFITGQSQCAVVNRQWRLWGSPHLPWAIGYKAWDVYRCNLHMFVANIKVRKTTNSLLIGSTGDSFRFTKQIVQYVLLSRLVLTYTRWL